MSAHTSFDDGDRTSDQLDLRQPLGILRRHLWLPLLLGLLAATAAYARAESQPELYAAHVVVRVSDPGLGSTLQRDRVDPVRQVDIQVLYAKSRTVLSQVESALGDDADRVKRFTATAVSNADAINLTAESRNPRIAQTGARVYASEYIDARRTEIAGPLEAQAQTLRTDADRLREEVKALDDQIAAFASTAGGAESPALRSVLDDRVALVDRASTLSDRATQLEVEATVRQSELSVIDDAKLPTQPRSPRPLRDGVIGAVIGLLLGSVLAYPFHRSRDRVWSESDIDEATLGMPVIGVLPAMRPGRTSSARRRARVAEVYRAIRASILFGGQDHPTRSVLVAGAGAGTERSTIALNLAATLAQGGAAVAYVDTDLRRPPFDLGLSNERDLASYLRGEVDGPRLHRVDVGRAPRNGSLDVIGSSEAATDAADLLTSPRLQALIERLGTTHQHVVVHGGSLDSTADSLNVASLVDAVVLVVAPGKTRRRELWTSVSGLLQIGAPLKGCVLDGSPGRNGVLPGKPTASPSPARLDAATSTDRA